MRGVEIKGGAMLWPVGSDTIKGVLTGRLKMSDPPMVHFSAELPADFYAQISAERLVTKYIKGFPRMEWVKSRGDRNEALDCWVYGYAAAIFAGIKRTNWTLQRQRIEAQKPTQERPQQPPALKDQTIEEMIETARRIHQAGPGVRGRGNWANNW